MQLRIPDWGLKMAQLNSIISHVGLCLFATDVDLGEEIQ